jgi:hypothetical protein
VCFRPPPLNSSVRLLALNFRNERKTCLLLTARGSLPIKMNASLSRCAAALRGILDAACRELSSFFEGVLLALSSFNQGQPNKSFEPTASQLVFHPQDLDA